MSIVPKETILVIAQTIGVDNLLPDVAGLIAPDVEYRVREIMQEAIKCMRHSKRTVLTSDDVDSALKLRNIEPIYGFASGDPLPFKRASGHNDLFYVDDKDVEFKAVIEKPLPKAPLDTSICTHWLAIEGVQPAIPENAPIKSLSSDNDTEFKDDGFPVDVKLPMKHVLSMELQLYFEKITDLTLNRSGSVVFKEALLSLATDSGLHPLVPYFTYFIADEVSRNLQNFCLLFALMRVVKSLLQNPLILVEPYLHQLMPSVITCIVAKKLGNRISDNHWELRSFAANLVALICKRFGHVYHNLQPRVTRTLLHAFLDPTKALPQHYGAIQGLAALGPNVVRLLILPNLEPYLHLLEQEMKLESLQNEMKRYEAWRVYEALMSSAGLCMCDHLKKFPGLLSPPAGVNWKSKGKIMSIPNMTNKRKASMDDNLIQQQQQPPLKKSAIDGPIGVVPLNSLPIDMQGSASGLGVVSTISRQLTNENALRSKFEGKNLKLLAQTWKDDTDAGNLVASLFQLFGERMFSFTPASELSLFL